jgi:hypothetical protein
MRRKYFQNHNIGHIFLFVKSQDEFFLQTHIPITKALRFFTLYLHNMFQPWPGSSSGALLCITEPSQQQQTKNTIKKLN